MEQQVSTERDKDKKMKGRGLFSETPIRQIGGGA